MLLHLCAVSFVVSSMFSPIRAPSIAGVHQHTSPARVLHQLAQRPSGGLQRRGVSHQQQHVACACQSYVQPPTVGEEPHPLAGAYETHYDGI